MSYYGGKTLKTPNEHESYVYGAVGRSTPGGHLNIEMRQVADVRRLEEHIAQNGSDYSLYRTIGRWNDRRLVRERGVSVYVPYVILDFDGTTIADGYEKMMANLAKLDFLDPDRILVSLSGGKGFHVEIHMSQFAPGHIFENSDVARSTLRAIVENLGIDDNDPATLTPLTMFRLSGTRHMKTGLYKTSWTLEDFVGMDLYDAMKQSTKFRVSRPPETWHQDDMKPMAAELFEDAVMQAKQIRFKMELKKRHNIVTPPGKPMMTALQGLEEGEKWARGRNGRDWAAFTIACYCAERPEQHQIVREILSIDGEPDIEETMNVWNERNTPPMPEYVIRSKIKRAIAYVS